MVHFPTYWIAEWSEDALARTLNRKSTQLERALQEARYLSEQVDELTAETRRRDARPHRVQALDQLVADAQAMGTYE